MLGFGWTEMLVIGVVALIVIGPRELPALMHRTGKIIGSIRRMGQDFQREINKSTGLDAVTDIRKSITEPLKKTTAEIRKEFNAVGVDGMVKPTGAIKPTDPKVESVVDSIKQQAGIAAPTEPVKTGAAASAPAASAAVPVKAAVLPKVPAQPTAPVAMADLPAPVPEPVVKIPRKRVAKPKPVDSPAPVEAIAPSQAKPKRAPRRKPAASAAPQGGPATGKPGDEA